MQSEQVKVRSPRLLWLTICSSILFIFLLVAIGVCAWALRDLSGTVAEAIRQKSESMQITTEICDNRGRNIGVFSDETRFVVPYEQIPKRVKLAFIAAEDDGFFNHWGVSPRSIIRAAISNIRRDRYAEGGSTITQQLVRQFLLSRDKKLSRKIREIIMAIALERQMSKDEILGIWMNSVYLGNNAWGVEAASRHYFDKSVRQLDTAEASMIAGLPQAPSRYAPHIRPRAAKDRQLYVLKRLRDLRWISPADFKSAESKEVKITSRRTEVIDRAPWVTESVRLELWRRLEQKNLPKTGLVVNTTIDRDWQLSLQSLIKGSFSSVRKDGLEVAVIVLDAHSGDIRAQIGGSDFYKNQFNRALDLYRPMGAAIYPLVFAWGIERGIIKVDGYSSIAEAAIKSQFAEAEQLAPEIGYGLIRDKLMSLGFVVKDAMAIDEMHGSPLNLARAYLGIAGAEELVPRGMISSVLASGQSIYSSDQIKIKYPAKVSPSASWVVRKWMALGSDTEASPLAGQPVLKSAKGWNDWWIISRNDIIVAAWVGADSREPKNPSVLQNAESLMDQVLIKWIRKNIKNPNGIGATPDGISYMVYPTGTGKTTVRVPFVSSGYGVF